MAREHGPHFQHVYKTLRLEVCLHFKPEVLRNINSLFIYIIIFILLHSFFVKNRCLMGGSNGIVT